jgi:ElaB/YqjD/DUF883 family membrane-anchored ribosome-binding protein
MADVTTTLKDAAYITVGLGVLGFQKAQVRRVELRKQLEDQRANVQVGALTQTLEAQLTELTRLVKELAQDVDARFVPVRVQIEERIDAMEERLPEQARELVKQARSVAKDTEAQLRSHLGLVAA